MSEDTKNDAISQIQESYLRISKNKLILNDSVTIEKNTLDSIATFIDSLMVDGLAHLSKIEAKGFQQLPQIEDFQWNIYLLQDVIDKYMPDKYRVIELKCHNWKKETGIVIEASEPIHDMVDVVVSYWKKRGQTKVSEFEMKLMRKSFGWDILPMEVAQESKRMRFDKNTWAYRIAE